MSDARTSAHRVLMRVDRDEAFSHLALDAELERSDLESRDRGLATELVYGALTWRRALDAVLDDAVHGGVRSLDLDVLNVLRLGVYQGLFLSRVPDHAIVDESVRLTREEASDRATGLVNAVLHGILNDVDELQWWNEEDAERKPVRYLGERYSLPNWMTNRLIQMYGFEEAERQAEAYTKRPGIFLRGATLAGIDKLATLEDVEAVEGVPNTFRAEHLTDRVRQGLDRHEWVVQDLGSQLVGWFAGAKPGQKVLDGCAGLGGKTLHLAYLVGDSGHVQAVDTGESKLFKLQNMAEELHVQSRVDTQTADLREWASESDERFDVVLIDAPCSGLGVMRRHPEIRWKREESDISSLVTLQRELLDAAASLVEPGGVLAYSVCTFLTEEGPKQAASFVERHEDFERIGAPDEGPSNEVSWSRWATEQQEELKLNPADHDADGFFGARFRKT